MEWTYCERQWHGLTVSADGMASRISCERRWHGLTVSDLMARPHEYLFLIPQSIIISTPAYLLTENSDCRPKFSACLGGGGGGGVGV